MGSKKRRIEGEKMARYIVDMMNEKIDMETRVPVVAPATEPMGETDFESCENTRLYWLGGGGFMVNSRGTILLIDPILETRSKEPLIDASGHKMLQPFPMETRDVKRCDLLLFTHDDGDHANPETVNILADKNTKMLGTARVFETLVKNGMKPDYYTVCHAREKYQVNDIEIEILPGDHPWQLIDGGRCFYPEDCVGFIVKTKDGTIVFTGDTRLLKEHIGIPDVVVLPLDVSKCVFHLGRPAAALLANKYPDAYIVPYHYGMFDYPECPAQEGGDPWLVLKNVNNSEKRGLIVGPGHPVVIKDGKLIR